MYFSLIRHDVVKVTFALLCTTFMSSSVWAAFTVSPIRVDLTAQQKIVSLKVHNPDQKEVSIQVDLVEWKQNKDQDLQEQISRDVLISPPIFTLPAGESQIVRVGARRPFDATQELSYRLFLKELAGPTPEGFQGLRMLQTISMPIFMQPTQQKAQAQVQWQLNPVSAKKLELQAENTGNAHMKITALNLNFERGEDLSITGNFYVLPNGRLTWQVPLTQPWSPKQNVELTIKSDQGEITQKFILAE